MLVKDRALLLTLVQCPDFQIFKIFCDDAHSNLQENKGSGGNLTKHITTSKQSYTLIYDRVLERPELSVDAVI